MAQVLEKNPAHAHFLLSLGLVASRIAEWDSSEGALSNRRELYLERLVALLGKTPVRNLVGCMRIARLSAGRLPTKTGATPTLSPREQLKYALMAEDDCDARDIPGPNLAYAAGLHYDWICALAAAAKAPPEVVAVVAEAFAEALQLARLAFRLGRRLKVFKHGDQAYAAALLLPLGNPLMAAMYPKSIGGGSWAQCVTDAAAARAPWALEHFEARRFKTSRAELGGLLMSALGLIEGDVREAVGAAAHPRDLDTGPAARARVDLAAVLGVSASLARWAAAGAAGEPSLTPFLRTWLTRNGVEREDLHAIAAEARG